MTYFRIYYGGKYRGMIQAVDTLDARWRFASRFDVPVAEVSASELLTEWKE